MSKPILVQAVIGVIIGLIVVLNTAMTDHVLHDFYVKPTIGHCFPTNQDTYCTNMRALHGVDKFAQLELGEIYWNELARQAVTIGIILFIFRISISLIMHQYSGMRKIRLIDLYIAFLWGITASIIFVGGFLDLAYYDIQDEPIPSQLPWLNSQGLFQYSQDIFGEKNVVDVQDLYATMLISFGLIAFLWFIASAWWISQPIKTVI